MRMLVEMRLSCVRSLLRRNARYSIELVVVRSLLEEIPRYSD